jgi:FkbM family methyltransferase
MSWVRRLISVVAPCRCKGETSSLPRTSYAQCGEDLVVGFVLEALGITQATYLDIGAHHPTKINNTYAFYKQGGSGVCIEPDPAQHTLLKRKRPKDLCLNIGVGPSEETSAKFYVLRPSTLSTFSEKEAKRFTQSEGAILDKVLAVPMISLNTIFEQYFETPPDFISIDVEGLEIQILQAADLYQYRPIVFCIETLSYSSKGNEEKSKNIITLMSSRGYMVYGDTYINTIFVDEERWRNRKRKQMN